MEGAFFILIILAVLAYGIQMPLLTVFVRKLDGLTVTVYRNLSFIITMFPLLFFVSFSEILLILDNLLILFMASLSGVIAFSSLISANKYLPVGLNSGIRQGLYVVFAFVLGYLFFGEVSTTTQLLVVLMILTSTIILSTMKVDISKIKEGNIRKGLILVVLSGMFHAFSFFFFATLSRNLNPFVATYFWESLIGVLAFLYAFMFGGNFGVPKLKLLKLNEIVKISLIALLTIIGTLSYSFAIKIGSFSIATSLITTTVVVYMIMGYLLFREKLNYKQLFFIGVIILGTIILKLIS